VTAAIDKPSTVDLLLRGYVHPRGQQPRGRATRSDKDSCLAGAHGRGKASLGEFPKCLPALDALLAQLINPALHELVIAIRGAETISGLGFLVLDFRRESGQAFQQRRFGRFPGGDH
jgi:hypothetical protein